MPEIVPPDLTDRSSAALLLVDVVNDFDFDEGQELQRHAVATIAPLQDLSQRCRERRVPVIYANDNFGAWRSDIAQVLRHCSRRDCLGRRISEALAPQEEDYVVLKPKHSAFFCTTLELLLSHLGVERLILAGLAGNICVFFTAYDAHMRDIPVIVVGDGTASNTVHENDFALQQMERVLGAEVCPAGDIDLDRFTRPDPDAR